MGVSHGDSCSKMLGDDKCFYLDLFSSYMFKEKMMCHLQFLVRVGLKIVGMKHMQQQTCYSWGRNNMCNGFSHNWTQLIHTTINKPAMYTLG